jgi:hypothetical protein
MIDAGKAASLSLRNSTRQTLLSAHALRIIRRNVDTRFFFGVARSFPRRTAGAVESSLFATPALLAFRASTLLADGAVLLARAEPLPLIFCAAAAAWPGAPLPLFGFTTDPTFVDAGTWTKCFDIAQGFKNQIRNRAARGAK